MGTSFVSHQASQPTVRNPLVRRTDSGLLSQGPIGFRARADTDSRWNTSRVLSDYLRRNPAYARDLTVLELGAGAGLPSLVCSVLGARRVMITDYPDVELVENIRWNVETNLPLTMRRNVNVEVSSI